MEGLIPIVSTVKPGLFPNNNFIKSASFYNGEYMLIVALNGIGTWKEISFIMTLQTETFNGMYMVTGTTAKAESPASIVVHKIFSSTDFPLDFYNTNTPGEMKLYLKQPLHNLTKIIAIYSARPMFECLSIKNDIDESTLVHVDVK